MYRSQRPEWSSRRCMFEQAKTDENRPASLPHSNDVHIDQGWPGVADRDIARRKFLPGRQRWLKVQVVPLVGSFKHLIHVDLLAACCSHLRLRAEKIATATRP